MAGLKAIISKVQSLNMREIAQLSVLNTTDQVVELNQMQLTEGLNAKGDLLGATKPYRPYKMEDGREYADFKNRINPVPGYGNPDLYLTGAFYEGMYGQVENDVLRIDSRDSKSNALQGKYGRDIFGLTEESKAHYVRVVLKPEAFNELKKQLR